jgi:hypothetical protein
VKDYIEINDLKKDQHFNYIWGIAIVAEVNFNNSIKNDEKYYGL